MNNTQNKEWVKKIAQRILGLPPLPTVVAKLIEMIDDPRTNARSLGKLISTDQSLTARVLKLANSSYYGFPRRISTINLALVVLGFDMLKNLCISVSMRQWFSDKEGEVNFDMSRFWEHSIACGTAAKMVARECGYMISGEVFVAGLLHDIGKLVLKQYIKPEFKKIIEVVEDENILFIEAEEKVLGINHAAIGSLLAERWNLPSHLVNAIAYHHNPEDAENNYLHASLVHFANYLVRYSKIGFSGDDRIPKFDTNVAKNLKLKTNDDGSVNMDYYIFELQEELEKAETFINLIHESERSEIGGTKEKKVIYANK
ncbi:HDOD domain-containing protein [bacterium]|nr:HDOD domain-containing protein [bacterium]